MPLTDVSIRAAKPARKPVKLSDERGLFLLAQPSGGLAIIYCERLAHMTQAEVDWEGGRGSDANGPG